MDKYDILIVGAGVAGMTAAVYGLRAKKSVAILEKAAVGGQILQTTKLDNYPGLPGISGVELAEKLRGQVKQFGGHFVSAEVVSIEKKEDADSKGSSFVVATDDEPIEAKSIIIANGSKERKLGLENEERLIGHGVSYCATCDGALFKDKDVLVYGGGNTAAYSVLYLAGICRKVYWMFRKPAPRAEKHLVETIEEKENVEIMKSSVVTHLEGQDKLERVDYHGEADESMSVSGIFVLIGREPDNERFKNLVELDETGHIVSDETCTTRTLGVFCAGDTRAKKLNQIVTATADGAVAASGAIEYLNKLNK